MTGTRLPYGVYTAVINSDAVGMRHQWLAAGLIMAEVDLSAWLADPSSEAQQVEHDFDLLEKWGEAKDEVEEFWATFESASRQWRSTVGLGQLDEVLSRSLATIRGLVPEAAEFEWG